MAPMETEKKKQEDLAASQDVTGESEAAERARAMIRLVSTLSSINNVMVREDDRDRFLTETCRILVEQGGLHAAWVGFADFETGEVRLVGGAGLESSYFKSIKARCDNSERGNGPFGKAVRSGRFVVCNDTETEPLLRRVANNGSVSCAAFPLRVDGRVIGAFNCYSAHAGFFAEDIVTLLNELAASVGYALQSMEERSRRLQAELALRLSEEEKRTEQRRAEETLRISEEKYRRLFQESKDAVTITTPEGRFIDINPAGVELFGYSSREEMLLVDIVRDLYFSAEVRREFARLIGQNGYVKDYELAMKRKDGHKLIVNSTAGAVRDNEGNIAFYWAILRDMTAHKALQEQLLQSQKMESIGRLVGAVAHDFNNILTGIIGFSDLAMMGITEEHPLWVHLDQIRRQGERAAALTRQLLAFSSRQVLERRNIDLNQIITDIDTFLRRVIGEDIHLKVVPSANLGAVYADPAQIGQVLMNLCVNARDSMPDGGRLTIETSNIYLDGRDRGGRGSIEPGDYVRVTVSDTGVGMTREVKEHLFEPFFTTKGKGKGTGLGLATVYGIVKQHGGLIHVRSGPGRGTTVFMFFKASPGVAERFDGAPSTEELRKGDETILVAEDEESVRDFVCRALRAQGYEVILAPDGEEVLQLFEANRGRVRMAVLDVVMPRLGGIEAFEKLRARSPGLRCLLMSGYIPQDADHGFDLKAGMEFLQKPFSAADLIRRVREILDKS